VSASRQRSGPEHDERDHRHDGDDRPPIAKSETNSLSVLVQHVPAQRAPGWDH
jgi:hypothetical protein